MHEIDCLTGENCERETIFCGLKIGKRVVTSEDRQWSEEKLAADR